MEMVVACIKTADTQSKENNMMIISEQPQHHTVAILLSRPCPEAVGVPDVRNVYLQIASYFFLPGRPDPAMLIKHNP